MVTITNKVVTLQVTKGAYNNFFKRRGFHIVNDAEKHEDDELYTGTPGTETLQEDDSSHQETDEDEETEDDGDEEEEEDDEEETEDDDLSEIPLSDMNKEQLCSYAERLGLDPSDLTKKELRELIREHLEK